MTLSMQDLFVETEWPGIVMPTKIQEQFPGLTIGFTSRNGGVSESPYHSLNVGLHVDDEKSSVYQNRERVAEHIGFPVSKWAMIEQVHGAHIERLDKGQFSINREIHHPIFNACDGIYTRDKDVLLVTFYADCTPIYFFAPKYHLIGLAHSGWRGTAAQIGKSMIEIWLEQEAVELSDIHVVIGPAIGSCCYTVNNQVRVPILESIEAQYAGEVFTKREADIYDLDLKKAIYYQMKKIGVKDDQIYRTNHCTSCLNEVYFSYRRDRGQTGRMMSFIGLKEDFKA